MNLDTDLNMKVICKYYKIVHYYAVDNKIVITTNDFPNFFNKYSTNVVRVSKLFGILESRSKRKTYNYSLGFIIFSCVLLVNFLTLLKSKVSFRLFFNLLTIEL